MFNTLHLALVAAAARGHTVTAGVAQTLHVEVQYLDESVMVCNRGAISPATAERYNASMVDTTTTIRKDSTRTFTGNINVL